MDRDSRNILLIIIFATLFKMLYAAPLYLLDDEAYYWVWSRNLSLSYFDHPPMIAILIRLSTTFFGDSFLGIRALGAIATGISIWFGLDLTYRIYQDKRVLWNATWLFLLALPFFAAGIIMTPDTPMMLFLTLALWSFYRAAFEMKTKYWWVSGICFGLALLSKYTAILWLGSVFLLLVVDPHLRHQLRRPTPWLAGAITLLLFSPVIYWNAAHDWASFKFQLGHGLELKNPRPLFYLGEYFAGQAGLMTPGIFLLILALWGKMTASWKKLSGSERFLLVSGFTPFLFFMYAGSRTHVEANWPALTYLTGIIIAARWHANARGWQKWIKGINYSFLILFLLIIIVQAHFKVLPLNGKNDPTNRYYGWPGALDQIEQLWHEYPQAMPVGNKYQIQSQVAYRFKTISTPALNIGGRSNHFEYFDYQPLIGRDILIVSSEREPRPAKFQAAFDTVNFLKTITIYRNSEPVKKLQVYLGNNYHAKNGLDK